jgi:phosphoglycerate kinase
VLLCDDCIGDGVRGVLQTLRKGQFACLENLRFHPGEEANDPAFCRALAQPFDVYINDAFGSAHRAHASTVGMVPLVRERAAGPLMQAEVAALMALRERPKRPFVVVVGGAKLSDKIGMLTSLLGKVDTILVGGAMAYTFLAAQGVSVGKSMVEQGRINTARELLERAATRETRILLPTDHIAARDMSVDATPLLLPHQALPAELMGLDIGPQTRATYADVIRQAATVFWNGPMGVSAWPAFAAGTQTVCEAIAQCPGHTVVGGGDSIAALEASHHAHAIDHISTGGGAALALLEQGSLPGLDVLKSAG